MNDETLQLLRDIRNLHAESVELQRQSAQRYEQQMQRAEALQTRTEALQARNAALQQRSQRVMRYLAWIVLPCLSIALGLLLWSLAKRLL